MTSLRNEELIDVPAAIAWAALRNLPATHELFAGVLSDSKLEGDIRTVTFAGGMTVQERVISVDDTQMRIVYAVLGEMFEQHAASMQIVSVEAGRCRFVWISDFLPDDRAEMVGPLMTQGCTALKRVLERRRT